MLRSAAATIVSLFVVSLAAVPAPAVTIDFEEFTHGDIVAAPIASREGYTLVVENFAKSFDAAVAFDTGVIGSLDPDLQFDPATGFAAGNIAGTDLGNILVIQANSHCTATHCSSPEDEGRKPAGSLTFLLDEVAHSFSFDLIDVEDATRENGSITFFRLEDGKVDVTVASFTFADFLALGQGVVYGNNSANHVFLDDIGEFNAFKIVMGGSGGIDNVFANGVPVPEPATAGLLATGLAGLAAALRRLR